MKYKGIFFDLDGTLLRTLEDIVDALNKCLKECGLNKQYSYEEGKHFLGGGAKVFTTRALKNIPMTEAERKHFDEVYISNYEAKQGIKTRPFDGISELLTSLKKQGCLLFVVTNKPHALTVQIIDKMFGQGLFDEVLGHKEGNPTKPDPFLVNQIKEKYHLENDECIYVGDSKYDIDTGNNAGIDVALVTYGYEDYTKELLDRATFVAGSVKQLGELL